MKLSMSVEAAALSFLGVAKRALKHNGEVITFLLGEILMKNLSEMTLEELVSRYNSLCVAAGKKPRKSFDSKKAALEAIEKLMIEKQIGSHDTAAEFFRSTQTVATPTPSTRKRLTRPV